MLCAIAFRETTPGAVWRQWRTWRASLKWCNGGDDIIMIIGGEWKIQYKIVHIERVATIVRNVIY